MTKEEAKIIMPLIKQFEKYNHCKCDHSWELETHGGKDCEYDYNEKLIAEARELRVQS